ncbi:MAG: YkvA family protein [Filomicrobium sp.]
MLRKLEPWARRLKQDVIALYIAGRDPRTPWFAKALAIAVVAYAVSPIDLIPDFIPVLGYLDDLLIVPLGILAVVSLMPASLMAEYRLAAKEYEGRPVSWVAASAIIVLWVLLAAALIWWVIGLV